MFSAVRRLFGNIKAEQTPDEIIVSGVPGYFIQNDINNIWRTNRISNFMFNKITRHSFSIPTFFAIDLLYTLETIINSKKRLGTSKKTAQSIIDALKESTFLSNIDQEHNPILNYSKLNKFWKTPLPHQNDFFAKYDQIVPKYDLKGYLLAAAAGGGKTLTAAALMEMLEVDTVFVICPNNAVWDVWYKTIASPDKGEFKKPETCWVSSSGSPYGNQKYLIFHYEALYKALELAKKLPNKKIGIILDECHNLNEITSQRTRYFIDLTDATKSEHILWMSGTPIKAMGSETIPLFRTIDKNFNNSLIEKYKKLYGKDAKKALDILSNRLNIVTHKVEKKALNLDPPIMENILVQAKDSDQYTLDAVKADMVAFIEERIKYYKSNYKAFETDYYDALKVYEKTIRSTTEEREFKRYLDLVKFFNKNPGIQYDIQDTAYCNKFEKQYINPTLDKETRAKFDASKSVVKYMHLKVQGECLGRILGKKRMECAKAVAENIDYIKIIESTTKKTVVFTSYVEVVEKAKEITTKLELQPAVVYAKTNAKLPSIISSFEKDKNVNPLIATYPSLSTAVPLVMADTMILINTPFRDYVLQQAISRINRLGQTTQPYVYIAMLDTGSKPNLSTRTVDILKWSQSQVSSIMGIESPFVIEESGAIANEAIGVEDIHISNLDPNNEFHISFEELVEKEYII